MAKEPTGSTRLINFVVNDGLFDSPIVSTLVTIQHVNDPPLVMLSGGTDVNLMYTEGQTAPLVLAENITITGKIDCV